MALAFLGPNNINKRVANILKTDSAITVTPIAKELSPVPRIVDAFQKFQHQPGVLLLDSSRQIQSADKKPLGRYSFLMADPFDWIECKPGTTEPLADVRKSLASFQIDPIPGLPPLQGGLAGLLSYDLNRSMESINVEQTDEFGLPLLAMGCYDTMIAWDHQQQRAWIISSGLPETCFADQNSRALSRIDQFLKKLNAHESSANAEDEIQSQRELIAPSFGVKGPAGLISNFSRADYITAVQKCIDYIYAGDVFQINLTQRLLFPANRHAAHLFEQLRRCNPAPFSGYFDLSAYGTDAQIISASPERFFAVQDRVVETRPIKGTRKRTGTPMVDIHARGKLEGSKKDRAENMMIVDLMRNDLSRCCNDDSICVTQLCELEEYQSVLHLVSAVQGKLAPDSDLVDLIQSIFPGGSITGAPKIRAMEIIAELEPTARGAYCGALGYLGFDGSADFNILIRTITASGGWWQIPVGGGIVGQSDPVREYEETWTKAAGMLRAISS